jgi:hypothetical protein
MTHEDNGQARAALDANIAYTRHTIALQIAVEGLRSSLGVTRETIATLVRGHIDTLPDTSAAEYRLHLVRDILVAETTFRALTLRVEELLSAIKQVAPVQYAPEPT